MFASRVLKAIDIFEEGDVDPAAGLPVAAPDQFGRKRFEEAFDGGVVVAITFPAY